MGSRQEKGDGVGEEVGGGHLRPDDGGGADDEGAGQVDQVKTRQRDHQTENMNDEVEIDTKIYQWKVLIIL